MGRPTTPPAVPGNHVHFGLWHSTQGHPPEECPPLISIHQLRFQSVSVKTAMQMEIEAGHPHNSAGVNAMLARTRRSSDETPRDHSSYRVHGTSRKMLARVCLPTASQGISARIDTQRISVLTYNFSVEQGSGLPAPSDRRCPHSRETMRRGRLHIVALLSPLHHDRYTTEARSARASRYRSIRSYSPGTCCMYGTLACIKINSAATFKIRYLVRPWTGHGLVALAGGAVDG